jgi:hypothetical protein
LAPSTKEIKQAIVGPGTYVVATEFSEKKRSKSVIKTSFGTASRDTPFSKYSSVHAELVKKGLF